MSQFAINMIFVVGSFALRNLQNSLFMVAQEKQQETGSVSQQ